MTEKALWRIRSPLVALPQRCQELACKQNPIFHLQTLTIFRNFTSAKELTPTLRHSPFPAAAHAKTWSAGTSHAEGRQKQTAMRKVWQNGAFRHFSLRRNIQAPFWKHLNTWSALFFLYLCEANNRKRITKNDATKVCSQSGRPDSIAPPKTRGRKALLKV